MGKLFMGLLLGSAMGIVLGVFLGPTLVGAQNNADYTPPFDSKEKQEESNNEVKGLLDQIKGRIDEALAAAKDATREKEEELKQRYRDSIGRRR
jgi:hypothetical protein